MTDIGALLDELDEVANLLGCIEVGECALENHDGDDHAPAQAKAAREKLAPLRAYIRKAEKVIAAARADHIDANMMCVYHRPETRCKGCPNGVTPSGKRDHDGCPGEDWWERNMDSYERAFCDALADLDEGDTE